MSHHEYHAWHNSFGAALNSVTDDSHPTSDAILAQGSLAPSEPANVLVGDGAGNSVPEYHGVAAGGVFEPVHHGSSASLFGDTYTSWDDSHQHANDYQL
jgi:hypothetical protein